MKKRFVSVFLALALGVTQVYPSFADNVENVNDEVSSESYNEKEKNDSSPSEKTTKSENTNNDTNNDEIKTDTSTLEESDKNNDGEISNIKSETGNIYSDEDEKLSPLLKDFKKNLKGDSIEVEKAIYFVEYESPEYKDSVLEALNEIEDTKVLYEYNIIFQGCSVETWPKNLDQLKLIKGVKSVERSGQMMPLMNNVRKIIGIEDAQKNISSIIKSNNIDPRLDGRGMVISHIDTGLDASHRAMRIDADALASIKIKNGGNDPFWVSNKVPHAFNYMNGGKNTIEKYDDGSPYHDPHGMHIAGILAANDDPRLVANNEGIKGVAPNAQLLSYKMYSDSSDAFAGDETMFHAFEDSIKYKADVASISSGFTGTGLVGEKYWPAIRTMRKYGIPVFVATGNFATSASNSSWDLYANNALGMTDTGNVTRTAAHEDAIAVGSARNTVVYFPKVKIGHILPSKDQRKDFRYSQIGAFFDKSVLYDKKTGINGGKYTFVYLGKCQDEDIRGLDLRDKIVVMDRIYTGDLKYAFKKVQDKGAKMVIVVNTVSYYNRDDWENVPAMGYEKDEKTSVQVISLSGYDGAELWDMIKSNKKSRSADVEPYRIDMKEFNSRKPKVGDMARLDIEFTNDLIKWEEKYQVPAGSTSWGPRTDLMLKPDLSAPGKNIYSTLNKINGKDDYAYMSGTSMSTPVAAGASVLIRPKLKEMVKSNALKSVRFAKDNDGYKDKEYGLSDSDFTNGIDLSSLTKIVMQNTATPMKDISTAINNDITSAEFASPRQQGAGLINVEHALKTDVIATHETKDSVGIENAYGSVSLKEIRGGQKDFEIKLYNTSDKPITFDVVASPVTTDGEKKVTKLDEEYIDEEHNEGKQIVAEIHPEKVEGARITFANDKITVPANSSYTLNATMHTGSAADGNKFVESFIKFTPLDSENSVLTMPVMGFAGDWNKESIIDKWAWEDGSLSGKITVFDDNGKPKRPGTLNYGAGGEHGVDNFHPAGVIQNLKGGNPDFKQDPDYFAMNTGVELSSSKPSDSKLISGKQKKIIVVDQYGKEKEVDANDFEVNNAGLTPSPLVLRSASDSKIYIANENGKNLRTMAVQHFVRGILNSKRNTAKGLKDGFKKVWGDLKWDGTIFDTHANINGTISGELMQVAEGQYYYTFEYRLTPDYPWQKTAIPIKIDNTPPVITDVDLSNLGSKSGNIKIYAKDTFHKAKDLSKAHNGVYFKNYQKENPTEFEEIATKLWYVGAGIVDNSTGEVKEHLDVIRLREGEYVIEDCNYDIAGKTLEIVAVDGAGNYAPTVRVVFDSEVKNGKLGYKLQGYDETNKKFDEKKSDNIEGEFRKEKKELVNPSNPNQGLPKEENVTGAPTISVDKGISTLGEMKEVKVPKEKTFEKVTTPNEETYKNEEVEEFKTKGEDCTIKDTNGFPKYYDVVKYNDKLYHTKTLEEGDPVEFYWDDAAKANSPEEYAKEKECTIFPMEYDVVTQEQMEKDGKFLITLNENNGFSVIGTLDNVDRNTKVYFQSEEMKKIRKTQVKEISTFDYDNHSMKFDFYGNRNDSTSGTESFNYNGGKVYIWAVNNNGEKSNELTLAMPDAFQSSIEKDPMIGEDDHKAYSSGLDNIVEFKGYTFESGKMKGLEGGIAGGEKGKKTIYVNPSDEEITNSETNKTYKIFNIIIDALKVKRGYALRIVSYNAGKTSLQPISDRIYAEDPAKMNGAEETIFDNANIGILQGFNALRFEVYKLDVDTEDKFIEVTRDSKENIIGLPEDKMIFEKGRCVFFDKDPVTLTLDEDTFNPYVSGSDMPEVYTRTNPMTVRGSIADKGGFMWHLRINHHIIDEYLIYGDLKVDNTRDFSFTTEVSDGDVLDFGVKDYSGNSTPIKKFKSLDKEEERQMPDKYKVYIDNTKPEIEVTEKGTSGDYVLKSANGDSLSINITDKIDSEKNGRIQERRVILGTNEITAGEKDSLPEPSEDSPWELTIIARDFAGNKSIKKYNYTGTELKKVNIETYDVEFDLNGGSGNLFDDGNKLIITKGEDVLLPYITNDITVPYGKEFDYWEVSTNQVTLDKKEGNIIDVDSNITVKAIWKDETQKEEFKIKFDLKGGKGSLEGKEITFEKGETYSLPDGKYITKRDGYKFAGWEIDGKKYNIGEEIEVNNNITIKALWEKEMASTPGGSSSSEDSSGGSSSSSGNSSGGGGSSTSVNKNKEDKKIPKESQKKQEESQLQQPSNINNTNNQKITKEQVHKIITTNAKDVSVDSWAAPAIANVINRKIMTGVGNNNFAPLKNITRAEMAQIVYNINGKENMNKNVNMSDVQKNKWYFDAVNYVVNKNIMVGYDGNLFKPENGITRVEFIAVIARMMNIAPLSTEESNAILKGFSDNKDVPSWAKNQVAAVVKKGIVKGDGKNLNLNNLITRQEAASILSQI